MVRMERLATDLVPTPSTEKGAASCRPSCGCGPALLYTVRFVRLALTTLRNGHTVLFSFGIIVSGSWIVGGPVERAARAHARGIA